YTVPSSRLFYSLSLHDALPICLLLVDGEMAAAELQKRLATIVAGADVEPEANMIHILAADIIDGGIGNLASPRVQAELDPALNEDRKSTRLNSSHEWISYAVFC